MVEYNRDDTKHSYAPSMNLQFCVMIITKEERGHKTQIEIENRI